MNRRRWKPVGFKLMEYKGGGPVTVVLWTHRRTGELRTTDLDGHWTAEQLNIEGD